MRAQVGDWLVTKGRTNGLGDERGEVVEVRSADGGPPYVVRWLRNDHETLVFPGPDAVIVGADEHATELERSSRRIARLQSALSGSRRTP